MEGIGLDIAGIIALVVSISGVIINYRRTRQQGIGAIAEGFDKLAPHLNQRIDDLEQLVKNKGKEIDEGKKRIQSLEDRDAKRLKGIQAVAGYLEQSEALVNQAAAMLQEGLQLLNKLK